MIRYLTKYHAIPPIYRALTTDQAYAEAKSLKSTVRYISDIYSEIRGTPYSKSGVFVEAAGPNVVREREIELREMTTAKLSSQWVSRSVALAMRHINAATSCQKQSAEFRILRLSYQ